MLKAFDGNEDFRSRGGKLLSLLIKCVAVSPLCTVLTVGEVQRKTASILRVFVYTSFITHDYYNCYHRPQLLKYTYW